MKKTAHKNSWKTVESRRKVKQKTKLAIVIIGLILLTFVLGKSIQLFKVFFQPSSITRAYTWDGSTNINLVFKSDQVAVLSFNPEQNTLTIVKIPEETYIYVPGGYGSWPLRSVYNLGQSEELPKGAELLISSLRSFLGIPFDGYLEIAAEPEDFVNRLKNPLAIIEIWGNMKTNLTPSEFLRLCLSLKGVRFDKVKSFDLASLNLLQESTLGDGQKVFIADNIKIDAFSNKLSEDKMGSERISVAIFNTTEVPGLAQKAARMVLNMGGNSIISTNAPGNFEKTQIIVNSGSEGILKTYTYKRLSQVFGAISPKDGSDCSKDPKCDKIPSEVIESRAQINIILGQDSY